MHLSGFAHRPPRTGLRHSFILDKLRDIDTHLKTLTAIVVRLDEKVSHLDKRMSNVEDRLSNVEGRLTKVEGTFRWVAGVCFATSGMMATAVMLYQLFEHHISIGWR